MEDSHRYAMLLSALPYHGPLFGAKQTPLSRLRLNQRLTMLEPADAACLEIVSRMLDWARQDPDRTDADTVAQARACIADITHPVVRELVVWRLELRTLIAALRRRRRGEPAPGDDHWGFGRWVGLIRRNWGDAAFRLEGVFPWLPEANRLMDLGDTAGLERLMLGGVWNHLERVSDGHHFDFTAVVIYVMRWDLIARWTSHDGEAAVRRFNELVATEPLAFS